MKKCNNKFEERSKKKNIFRRKPFFCRHKKNRGGYLTRRLSRPYVIVDPVCAVSRKRSRGRRQASFVILLPSTKQPLFSITRKEPSTRMSSPMTKFASPS